MKTLAIILNIILLSSHSFAGGGGGGNVLSEIPGNIISHTQRVFILGEENGIITFRNAERYITDLGGSSSYGRKKITREELLQNEALKSALETSSVVGWWVYVESDCGVDCRIR